MDACSRFGDSLTQEGFKVGGWAARLADRYIRRLDVINRGFSGYNSKWALELLPALSLPENAELVTVFLGANDAAVKESNPVQHVPLESYKENLKEIVGYFKNNLKARHVLVLSPPPLLENGWRDRLREKGGNEVESDRLNAVTKQYAEAAREVAKSTASGFVDLFEALGKVKEKEALFTDGLHLNEVGNGLVFDAIVDYIEKHISGLKVTPCKFSGSINSGSESEIPPLAPWWDSIDPDNFAKSLERSMNTRK